MPDLERERRLRQRYNFDIPVTFKIDAGGTRDGVGRYAPNVTTFAAWCRREEPQPASFENTAAGARDTAGISLATRYDARIVPGTGNSFEVDGRQYTISKVDQIGRERYMLIEGVRSS